MNIREAIKLFNNKEYKQYTLFYGEEEYLKDAGVSALTEAVGLGMPELNLSVFKDRPDALEVVRALDTLPFMDAHRIVLIKDTDILTAASPAECSQPIADTDFSASSIFIISLTGKPDKRKALYKLIEKQGMVVECSAIKDLKPFVVSEAQQRGLHISGPNALLLCEFCDNDMNAINSELEKLASICVGSIEKKDIERYVSRAQGYNIFKIHDSLCAKNVEAAKQLIDKMLEEDPYSPGIISLLSSNFRQMLVARTCKDAGYQEGRTVKHIQEETGAKEWTAKRAVSNSRFFTAAQLREGIKKLGRMDYDAKLGGIVLATDLFPLLVDIYMQKSK